MVFGSSQRNASRPVSSVGIERLLRIHSAFSGSRALSQQFFDVLRSTSDQAFNARLSGLQNSVEHLFDGRCDPPHACATYSLLMRWISDSMHLFSTSGATSPRAMRSTRHLFRPCKFVFFRVRLDLVGIPREWPRPALEVLAFSAGPAMNISLALTTYGGLLPYALDPVSPIPLTRAT